ncbi:oligopeptide transporter, OPT family [Pandoraea nosoerga]|uniref:Oligopeptide transporter, OPT family n=1 Tax=Pandoraea nosoerga TaxID=2508296 RepID=A0A5E4XPV1_9BURK|nr:oligopeptide transporter, OPT family [Pandoraea nosoerga]MBN4667322.1 oligopeptide transporter, OPT family [Pandoraea nosoerga]MBN4677363.1 oligopeptide transporter, OPT family [Pandoraea nosoerga]MBN4683283.1 oligopeptide transporter, OPT family [Pandoraea nosoerga]MBN4747220.1 oligopeptide transporter, OPT family [Pandoraea nosoerga]VVE38158.1 oligopeptide transporter, OPT family [Pandoraea nosoerga]
MASHPTRIPDAVSLPELTLRGMILGALITVVFTASNVYLGLKVGLTFSSSIPAAVISMAVLRALRGGNILENNMVQTQASAAGTLSSIIFVLPGLLMIGHWQGFPFWLTLAICASGGILGVLFTIPLRRAMVVDSDLPYPEGVAAAEILRVGSAGNEASQDAMKATGEWGQEASGVREIAFGGVVSALFAFATTGLKVLGESITAWVPAGAAVFRLTTGFSLALIGAGYLIGIVSGLAILLGIVLSWGIAVPVLTSITPNTDGLAIAAFANGLWQHKVRFIGAGTIGVAAVWTLITLAKPMIDGVKTSFAALGQSRGGRAKSITLGRTEQDLSPYWVIGLTLVCVAIWVVTFGAFLADAPLSFGGIATLVVCSVVFAVVFGFLVAAACGYMAGLVGSSASPISGIGIVAVVLVSLLILSVSQASGLLDTGSGSKLAIALALFTTSAVIAIATISNDNLQDLKTGWLVGATPWRQQVALLVGCVVGAAVIPPVLNLLYNAYGFTDALPRAGMDPSQALSAPQAILMTAIAKGIFTHQLDWSMLGIGAVLGIALIAIDAALARRGGVARVPVIAVGIGIYLPPTVGSVLVIGAVLAWIAQRLLKARAKTQGKNFGAIAQAAERRGVLLASGLIVGESLVGVAMAMVVGVTGSDAPLAIAGKGFAATSEWLALFVFAGICAVVVRRVLAAAPAAR